MKYFSGFLVVSLIMSIIPLTFSFIPLNALMDSMDIYQTSTDNSFGSLSRILVIEDEVEDEEGTTDEEEETDIAEDEEGTTDE